MSTDDDSPVLVSMTLGKNDNSALEFISSDRLAYYRRVVKAGKAMAVATREFYDALNDRREDL